MPKQVQDTTSEADTAKGSKRKGSAGRGQSQAWHEGVKDAITHFDIIPFNPASRQLVMVRNYPPEQAGSSVTVMLLSLKRLMCLLIIQTAGKLNFGFQATHPSIVSCLNETCIWQATRTLLY